MNRKPIWRSVSACANMRGTRESYKSTYQAHLLKERAKELHQSDELSP